MSESGNPVLSGRFCLVHRRVRGGDDVIQGRIAAKLAHILEELGARLYEADIVSFTKDQLDRILRTMDCIPGFRQSTGKDFRTDDFLEDMLYSLCLFIPQGQDSYAFIHT